MKKFVPVIVAIILMIGIGVGSYLQSHRRRVKPPPARTPHIDVEVQEKTRNVKVYRMVVENKVPTLVATQASIKADEDPKEAALTRMFEQVDTSGLANPIPKGTRLLGLKVKNGIADVNLSREFSQNFSGGSEEESFTIGAILKTLAQFSDVKKVRFLVEGKPLDTLGHLDLSEPQDVNWEAP